MRDFVRLFVALVRWRRAERRLRKLRQGIVLLPDVKADPDNLPPSAAIRRDQ